MIRRAVASSVLSTSESEFEILFMKFEGEIWVYDCEKVVTVGFPGKSETKIAAINTKYDNLLSEDCDSLLFETCRRMPSKTIDTSVNPTKLGSA